MYRYILFICVVDDSLWLIDVCMYLEEAFINYICNMYEYFICILKYDYIYVFCHGERCI